MHQERDEGVKVVDFPATRVAAYEHRGSAAQLDESVRRFIAWRKQSGLLPNVSATFNIVHAHIDASDCRYDLCAAADGEIASNELGVIAKTIPGGRCAMLRHQGAEHTLAETVARLHAWLPRSGERRRDAPLFMQRVRFGPGVPEHAWITDVFLPIE